ncbi:macrolide ABC transporter ATP-binding protein [Verrucomicrobia bacterium LW23]|nr:macrolide ABC transporter ATP-binding protein [Verrucomicrobia bacterium LW23]
MAMIEVRDVRKIYTVGEQKIHALAGVSLDIDKGEYVSIIGPSGSGKSTMMQLLGCLDTPTEGSIILDGMDVSRANSNTLSWVRNQKIGFVFQNFNLLAKLNVYENVELPLIYANMPGRERRKRTLEAIEAVGLMERINNRPNQLSGGQSQRVAIARALVNRPKIILADEPTGALDTQTGETILQLFREVSRRGNTVALVTHDPDIAMETPRRIELRDGKLVSAQESHYHRFKQAAQAEAAAEEPQPVSIVEQALRGDMNNGGNP